jgi:class 3 adenylate cyclase/tetratricopeptide (TPR) repeat protein
MRTLADRPERSIVTVLAVDTVNSTGQIATSDPDDAQELLDRIFHYLDGAVRQAGGLFVSYAGDGGCAVFGWPQSMEDHADRACQVAWSLQHPAEDKVVRGDADRPIAFRIGLHSGLVGLRRLGVGADDRLDSVGGTVHLAAALQKTAAPGTVLVSSKTIELCRSALDLLPQPDHALLTQVGAKVFRLEAEPRRLAWHEERTYRIPLIGRHAERRAVRNVLLEPGTGRRAAALIGPPGIGKSRLTATAIPEALEDGRRVLVFNGDSQKRTTPFAAMRSLLLEALGLYEGATDDEIEAALHGIGIDDLPANPLAAVMLAKRPKAAPDAVTPTQVQIMRALIAAFEAAAGGSRGLMVVEDVHWVDLESLDCLRLLADDEQTPWAILLTGRPEAGDDVERIGAIVVRLDALPRETMRELAVALWPHADPPPGIVDKVLDRADGNPFILEQIVLSTGAEGTNPPDLAPQRVQSVIHARLNRLSPSAKACAQTLSLLGQEVETEIAVRVLGNTLADLQRDRRELEQLEIVQRSTGATIRFRHALVAEASAETLPRPRRQEIHRAAIAAVTASYTDLGPHYERLAYYAEGARDAEKALSFLWQAGLRANRSSAPRSLFLIFEQAMRHIERIGEPADARFVDFVLMAFTQLTHIGEIVRMKPYLPRALELARNQQRQDKVCVALCHMGLVSWFEGTFTEGIEATGQALQIAESLNSLPLSFAAKFLLASSVFGTGDVERAIALLVEMSQTFSGELETARLGAGAIPGSVVRSYLSWFLMEVGRYEEGLPWAEQGLAIALAAGEPYSEVLARLGMGRNLNKLRRHRDAADCLEQAVETIRKNGYDPVLPNILGHYAVALTALGEARRAVELVEQWLSRRVEKRTGETELYYVNAGYAEALFALGERDRAVAAIDHGLQMARNVGNPCLIVQGLGLRAHLRRAVDPHCPQIAADLAEQDKLCRRHGLVVAVWR